MSQPRIQMNATILPNGKVLATGGSTNDEDAVTASLNADLYDPATNTFSSAGANVFPRLYHSNAAPASGCHGAADRWQPPTRQLRTSTRDLLAGLPVQRRRYAALRPTITGVTPATVGYGSPFQVQTPDAADIASVVLVRPGTPTHAFDMDQRLVGVVLHGGKRRLERDGATERQHCAARLLHAVRAEYRGRAVGREVREDCCLGTESGPGRHDHQPGGQCHRQPGRSGVVFGNRHRSGRNDQRVWLDVPRRRSRFELCRQHPAT